MLEVCGFRDKVSNRRPSGTPRLSKLTSVLRRQSVQGVVRLALSANKAGEGVGGGGTSEPAVGVDVANVDLDRSVVLGGDETAGSRAISVTQGERR